MLCRQCGYNHLTTLEQLQCAGPRRRQPTGGSKTGDSPDRGRVEIARPGVNGGETAEAKLAETSKTDGAPVTVKVTKGRPKCYDSNAARQAAYRERKRAGKGG